MARKIKELSPNLFAEKNNHPTLGECVLLHALNPADGNVYEVVEGQLTLRLSLATARKLGIHLLEGKAPKKEKTK